MTYKHATISSHLPCAVLSPYGHILRDHPFPLPPPPPPRSVTTADVLQCRRWAYSLLRPPSTPPAATLPPDRYKRADECTS
ncbi:hypothetical protein K443DRAFT_15658 [Laccaria amethystina LaAM-08-1]|uniref:Uncharacterized protein n=1 Tax=Laccaria amethystina LaAM-08-1 TaxID=1095629 RepID=A0A0C9WQF9_9AGAR|nr:hypothetical protein K443DRAFT_15658 [Laccaria amethystina LaAM-08-1]